jgi:uncharacterized protein with HEPN domain
MSRDVAHLKHIFDAIVKIESYTEVGRKPFLSESLRQDAVIRQLQIVGEATKRLSPALCIKHPEIPWRRMAGMRDVLIHSYDDVDLATVWRVTQQSLPDLKLRIAAILEEFRSTSEP